MLILWILDESVSVTELQATDANADSDLLTMAQYKILKLLMVRKKDVMKRMSCNMITAYAAIRSTRYGNGAQCLQVPRHRSHWVILLFSTNTTQFICEGDTLFYE